MIKQININPDKICLAEKVLIDNGIDADEASMVLDIRCSIWSFILNNGLHNIELKQSVRHIGFKKR